MLKDLIAIAKQASKIAQRIKKDSKELAIVEKSDWDFATKADFDTQAVIIAQLQKKFPSIPIIAEEQKDPRISADTFFVVDPIDGTAPYNHHRDSWGIMIGYIEKYQPKAGVIFLPDRNILAAGQKGKGATINGRTVRLNHHKPLRHTLIDIAQGPWVNKAIHQQLLPLILKSRGVIGLCSASGSTTELLEGKIGAYINFSQPGQGAKIWDFAPGAVLIEEAGGIVVNEQGQKATWNKIPMQIIFAANKSLLKEVVAAAQIDK